MVMAWVVEEWNNDNVSFTAKRTKGSQTYKFTSHSEPSKTTPGTATLPKTTWLTVTTKTT
jgi:hypothetical protein